MREGEGATLVLLLARELATFRATQRYGGRHLYSGVATACNRVDDGVFTRPCSGRCTRVGKLLAFSAAWLGCDVEAFYARQPARRRR